ncbi:TIGR02594 family protein [Pseudolabrys taiwanensis]|uniref:TIGR02594 family protein n=2 Tax=Pseudolabrys taiwanensis TaxID=331696 RepID=A0A346A3F6_9HYPH|nr:TIGR02594 family protein [Pseudolabrys taiwanensis]
MVLLALCELGKNAPKRRSWGAAMAGTPRPATETATMRGISSGQADGSEDMKRPIAVLITSVFIAGAIVPAHATGNRQNDRFANTEPVETITRSRSDAAEAAAQVPGAAMVLLEALRWRGRTAKQLGLPTQLWCADFMNFVFKKAGAKGTSSRAARSFLQYGKKLDGPRVGAIAIMWRKGPNNGHVGVVRGTDGQGNPIVVSGNHGPTVTQSVYPKHKVLAYVMPPDYVLEDMAAAARAAAMARQ